ncbi:MAG: bifunctional phosphopantothenoylcysteine decarboxylase/phosphopantothenate--cysteine ligase CoaBC [Blastocatellia bacterium]|nr:bifunctional phosphopantothenoylcysteine decarboxylase/phosphopantothenate--cysteine ligase CoaBC [Blastocatellia bacterium]
MPEMPRVALAVTGCIGAYKAAEILRLLQQDGVDVRVAMTESAQRFVGPVTFEGLSGHPVITSMWEPSATGAIRHIELAQSIDLLVVAPATANILAKFANGICDDFVTTLYVSTTVPVLVAPAMNVEMLHHPATQENLARLAARGVHIVESGSGYLACGMVGEGRLAEPREIADRALELLHSSSGRRDLEGQRVLVTAGPTRELIDPVRFVTNRSSGRMGYAVAEAAAARGAEVVLVSGPVTIDAPSGVTIVRVETAAEMAKATLERVEWSTLIVKSAAVADYRPTAVADRKIKKSGETMTIELEKTQDILAAVGAVKGDRMLVGFAAETDDLVANARKKLESKNADLIVANDVTLDGAGFDGDTNIAVIVGRNGQADELPMMSKRKLADRILDAALAAAASRVPR